MRFDTFQRAERSFRLIFVFVLFALGSLPILLVLSCGHLLKVHLSVWSFSGKGTGLCSNSGQITQLERRLGAMSREGFISFFNNSCNCVQQYTAVSSYECPATFLH